MKTKKLLLLLTAILLLHSYTNSQVLEQDSLALVAFYNSTGGPNWNNNSNWLTGPVNTWYGVTVQGSRVVELKVYSNNLIGILPNVFEELNGLYKITLSNNQELTGDIPESIFNVALVWLAIGNCALTGTIPNSIGNCACLKSVSFRENNLTGPIPPEIGNLTCLNLLDLHDNQLYGPIPHELGNCTGLKELYLDNNCLSGELPEELANLVYLQTLDVSHNQLEGDIPEALSNVTSYEFLYFHNNCFTGIPPWNENWLFVMSLWIQNNQMTFEDVEPHFVGYMWYHYSPQSPMGKEIDTVMIPGANFSIYSGTGGEHTEYFWYKNQELILQSTEADTLYLENISYADTGVYTCSAKNSLATELNLYRRPVHITFDTANAILPKQLNKKNIICFPNPCFSQVSIFIPEQIKMANINIYNVQGKCIKINNNIKINNSTIKTDLKGIKPGVYLLQMQTENINYSTKIIISKREI